MSDMERYIYHGSLDSAGRVLLPAELRSRLHLDRGDRVVLETEGSSVRLTPLSQVIREAQDYFCRFKEAGESIVDELLKERREEVARE